MPVRSCFSPLNIIRYFGVCFTPYFGKSIHADVQMFCRLHAAFFANINVNDALFFSLRQVYPAHGFDCFVWSHRR